MRISIKGDNNAAISTRGLLKQAGFAVVNLYGAYTIYIAEKGSEIVVDGIDCELERAVVRSIGELTKRRISLQRFGGNQSDQELHISIPVGDEHAARAVEVGILRGILQISESADAAAKDKAAHAIERKALGGVMGVDGIVKRPWWKLFVLLVLVSAMGRAQETTPTAAGSGGGGGTVTAVQPTGTQLHMVCDSGCGGAGAFADNSAFTFGTSSIGNIGAVVDDIATNSVAENSAGLPRMSGSRILYVDLSKTAANATAIKVDNSAVTQPVSGTFWQATQPSSIADGADVTLGAKADAKSTATDTTAVTIMQVIKEISAMEQAPASRAVTNAGTFAVQEATLDGAISGAKVAVKSADGDFVTLGAKTDAAATQTDGTAVSAISVLKEISAKAQSPAALPANQSVNVAQVNGVATTTGAGATGTGVQRVNDVASSATAAAVPASAAYTGGSDGTNLVGFFVDPCAGAAKTYSPVNIVTATTTRFAAPAASKKTYICSIVLVTAAANNVNIIEGTGGTCGTATAGVAGGTTAATGLNLAANGGLTLGNGASSVMATAGSNVDMCLITSAAVQLSGHISWVQR